MTLHLPWEWRSAQGRRHRSAFYDRPQTLLLAGYVWQEPHLLYRRHGWLRLRPIGQGKIDTMPLITHRFPLSRIGEAYRLSKAGRTEHFTGQTGYKFVPPFAVKINSIDFVSDGPRPRVAPPAYRQEKRLVRSHNITLPIGAHLPANTQRLGHASTVSRIGLIAVPYVPLLDEQFRVAPCWPPCS